MKRKRKLKETCCKKYEKGKKACKRCPIMAQLSKKRRKKLVAKFKKKKS